MSLHSHETAFLSPFKSGQAQRDELFEQLREVLEEIEQLKDENKQLDNELDIYDNERKIAELEAKEVELSERLGIWKVNQYKIICLIH